MERYKFDSVHSKMIVDAIVEGYRDYIEHRKDRYRNMKISSAFAWTKGNFIESKIAEISEDLNLTYRRAKAGLAWDYLQFIQGDKKILFLIKNAAYFNENNFSQAFIPSKKGSGHRRTYLHELSKINHKLEFPSIYKPQENVGGRNAQLSFFTVLEDEVKDELEEFQTKYNEFHILTYKIDHAFQISKIMHYLPNPVDNIAYEVEDLSVYISGAELTTEEREVVAPDLANDLVDSTAFDIVISEVEDKESN